MTIQEYINQGGTVDLVALAQQHKNDKKLSVAELAERLDISRSMLSQYLDGKYSNPKSVEAKLLPYLEEQQVTIGSLTSNSVFDDNRPGNRFYQSVDARRVMAVCNACQEFAAFGIIIGKPGYGKTFTLKQYASLPKVVYLECDDLMTKGDLIDSLEEALGIRLGYGNLTKRTNYIINYLNQNPGILIIVDEADKLISRSSIKKMEVLRKLVDKARAGLVIAGEPRLKTMLQIYDERFENRRDCGYELEGLSKDEAGKYLEALPMEQDAKDILITRACNNRNGCFRLLDRTLGNVLRVAKAQNAQLITRAMVEEASDMMML